MPANYSPSFAKNIIRRALRSVVDPHPTTAQLRMLRAHFGDECAYCGNCIHLAAKDAQLDHIDSAGPNHVGNRLFACEDCNEKEKRDANWRDFLRSKAPEPITYNHRAMMIQEWIDSQNGAANALDSTQLAELEVWIERATSAFDDSVEHVRLLRDQSLVGGVD